MNLQKNKWAVNLSWDVRYDAVLSNSVFSYFDSYEYAEKVLEAMYKRLISPLAS